MCLKCLSPARAQRRKRVDVGAPRQCTTITASFRVVHKVAPHAAANGLLSAKINYIVEL